jgi:hypothetical protein
MPPAPWASLAAACRGLQPVAAKCHWGHRKRAYTMKGWAANTLHKTFAATTAKHTLATSSFKDFAFSSDTLTNPEDRGAPTVFLEDPRTR